jgi:hypothetical protein
MNPTIKFGSRGEGIEYKLGDKELFINSTWIKGERIFTESIRKWNKGEELGEGEKKKVFVDIVDFYKRNGDKPIIVINRDKDGQLWESLANENIQKISKIEFTTDKEEDQFLYNNFLDTIKTGLTINDIEIKSKDDLDKYWETRKKN